MKKKTIETLQEDLRQGLFPYTLLPHMVIGTFLMIWDVNQETTPPYAELGLLLIALALTGWWLRYRAFRIACWLMGLGSTIIILLAHHWIGPDPILLGLAYPVIAVSLTLGTTQGAFFTLAASILTGLDLAWGHLPLPEGGGLLISSLAGLWATFYIVFFGQRSERTMISWAWEGYAQARRNLETARDRQVELKQALQDLELVTKETIRLNEMLSAARQAAEEARKAKEEFVANVSHELRTPLNMIIGFSDMILESPEAYATNLPPTLLADIAAIRRNSQHLASLVDDVLALSEAETGHMQLFKERVSVQELVNEAAEAVRALFEKKKLTLTIDIPSDLPPLYCDRTRIRQVILNLLSNAGRFTEKGGVQIRARQEEQSLVISVADTGPGVEPEKLRTLFEPFHQADQRIRRRYGGSGLGLAISKRFVEMHGGKIWLESQPGVGTTAHFSIPLFDGLETEPAPHQRWFTPYHEYTPRSSRTSPQVRHLPRIVVIEPEEAICQLIQRYLDGLEPVRVDTIEEAIAFLKSNTAIALILNETPTEAQRCLRRFPRLSFDIPIFSFWVPSQQTTLARLGVQDYLVKPITRQELQRCLKQVAPSARTILLVDDDDEARQLFGRMLLSINQALVLLQAEDGESALSLLRERQPDLLLLDLVMPGMDGFAILEEKSLDPHLREVPVVIISARDPQQEPIVSQVFSATRQEGLPSFT